MGWQKSKVVNRTDEQQQTNKEPFMRLGKYCEKHTTWDWGIGYCSSCEEGAPVFKRPKSQVLNGMESGKKEWERLKKLNLTL